jgi:hypothetical protein
MKFLEGLFETRQEKEMRRDSKDLPVSTLDDTQGNPKISSSRTPGKARQIVDNVKNAPGNFMAAASETVNPGIHYEIEDAGEGYYRRVRYKGKKKLDYITVDGRTVAGRKLLDGGDVDGSTSDLPIDTGRFYSPEQMRGIRG